MFFFMKNPMKHGREAVSEENRSKKRYQELQPRGRSPKHLQESKPLTQSPTVTEQQSNIETPIGQRIILHVSQHDQANEYTNDCSEP